MKKYYIIGIILIISFAGIVSILFVTRLGVGTSPDSVVYIGAARNFLAGKGLSIPFGQSIDSPMTHHAPLYPVLLGAIGSLCGDPLIVARWLNAILCGLLILFTGLTLMTLIQPPNITPLLGSIILFAAIPILELHAYAWTEPVFLLFSLLGMYAISKYIEKLTYLPLICSALIMSLATLTRYAGIALIGTGLLSIILFSKKKLLNRLIDAFVFGLISSIPLLLWITRNSLRAGTATSRSLAFHLITKQHFIQSINTLSGWFLLPDSISGTIKLLALIIIIGIVLGSFIITKTHQSVKIIPSFILILCVFIVIYPVFLVFSISFLDANTPLDNRILSPTFIPIMIVLLYSINGVFQLKSKYIFLDIGLVTIAIFFSVMNIYNGVTWLIENSNNGLGFSSQALQNSDFVKQMRELPSDVNYFSNSPHAVYILTGNPTRALPKEQFATTQQENPEYISEMNDIRDQFKDSEVLVIYFSQIGQQSKKQESEIIEVFSLDLYAKYNEGSIYTTRPEN